MRTVFPPASTGQRFGLQAMHARGGIPWLIAYFSLILVLCLRSDTIHAARFDFDATPGRLSKDVVPTHYQLDFDLDPSRDTFSGHVDIDLTLRKAAAEIVLQANELVARRAVLLGESGSTRELIVTPDKTNNLWRLSWLTRDLLAPGKWRLSIDYDGKVEQRGQGLYRIDYRTAGSDAQQKMLATQLQPTHARAVFPSFDEPAFRATFGIAITAPSGFASVSNMPVASQVLLADGRRRTEFARTPSMPTYLVALAVGEFDAFDRQFRRNSSAHPNRKGPQRRRSVRNGGNQAGARLLPGLLWSAVHAAKA